MKLARLHAGRIKTLRELVDGPEQGQVRGHTARRNNMVRRVPLSHRPFTSKLSILTSASDKKESNPKRFCDALAAMLVEEEKTVAVNGGLS